MNPYQILAYLGMPMVIDWSYFQPQGQATPPVPGTGFEYIVTFRWRRGR